MNILSVLQGSDDWLTIRRSHLTASEAPAALGQSKYMSRIELLNQKSTGLAKDVDGFTQVLFDRGHEAEANARPFAEEIIGAELYPITASLKIDGLDLLASLDGATLDESVIFEHKLFNESLAADVRSGNLHPHYTIQLDQQLLVSGAEKCLFMTSDGTEANMAWCWYEPTQEKFNSLVAGWKQFRADLEGHEVRAVIEKPKAAAILSLPALSVQIKGEVTLSNMPTFIAAADAFLEGINTNLTTDQHFSDAEANIKACDTAEKGIEGAKNAITAQVADIDQILRTMDLYKDKLRSVRLTLDKLVKSQKEVIKTNILNDGKWKFTEHVAALEKEIKPIRLIYVQPDFAGAMKGKRTLASLHEAVDTTLAAAKIATDATAKDIRAKLAWCKESAKDYGFLFMDLQQIIGKPEDDFKLVVTTRIADHKIAEAKKAQDAIEAAEKVRKAKEEAEKAIAEAARPVEQPAKAIETVEQLNTFIEQKNARYAATDAIHRDAVNYGTGMGKITCDDSGEISMEHITLTAPEYQPTADEAVDILAAAWQMSRREVARHLMGMNFGDIE